MRPHGQDFGFERGHGRRGGEHHRGRGDFEGLRAAFGPFGPGHGGPGGFGPFGPGPWG
ncbi:PadR family transcriptional regulator, partial [Streptomyces ipomoeae]|nr:PadR family transcriptional regulator [Streptomyces ipomoeae]